MPMELVMPSASAARNAASGKGVRRVAMKRVDTWTPQPYRSFSAKTTALLCAAPRRSTSNQLLTVDAKREVRRPAVNLYGGCVESEYDTRSASVSVTVKRQLMDELPLMMVHCKNHKKETKG